MKNYWVRGRKPHPIHFACKTVEQAESLAKSLVKSGYISVSICHSDGYSINFV